MSKAMGILLGLALAWIGCLTSLIIHQHYAMLEFMTLTTQHVKQTNERFQIQSDINDQSLKIIRSITIRQIGHDPIEWPNK